MKTLVWGYQKEFSTIIDRLSETGAVDLAVWIGTEKRCTYSRKNFMELDLSFPLESPVRCPDALYDAVAKDIYTYLEMQTRRHLYGIYYFHTMHDFLDHFQKLLNFYYHLLSSHQIQLVLIDKITHYGEDWILYALAKAMGIKTLLLFPSHFPERFFYVFNIEDFGYFREVPSLCKNAALENIIDPDLGAYMGYLKRFKPYSYSLMDAAYEFVFKAQPQAFYKWQRYRKYQKNLVAITNPNPNLNVPFVFFPFHLQPELTTFPLGDKYVDQILALETLSDLLPEGWFIYAKENLHQSEYMRGDGFFERLRRIKNLVMVPGILPSKDLIDKAQFTATITGTAGWETINKGKKALVFGRPWYLTLPGVIQYHPELTFEEIIQYEYSPQEVEKAIANLSAKMGQGTVGRQFMQNIQFDQEANAQLTAESLQRIIQHLENLPDSQHTQRIFSQ